MPKADVARPKIAKYIYDSVHGYVGVTEAELKVVDTPIFQRLRRIKQLGPADLVYPGATHTRFAHSIGTMHVMEQFLTNSHNDGNPIASNKSILHLDLDKCFIRGE